MRRGLAIWLSVWIALIEGVSAAEPVALVPLGSAWRWMAVDPALSDLRAGWTSVDFDDASWAPAMSGFSAGWGGYDDATPLASVLGRSTEIRARASFEILDPGSVGWLVLRVDYDDGFIAYLNGTEVARRNVGGGPGTEPAAGAAAAGNHDRGVAELIDLSEFAGLLRAGRNVLAFRAFNESLFSYDFSLVPELLSTFTRGPLLQRVDTGGGILRWETPAVGVATVEWGLTPALGQRVEIPPGTRPEFRFTGLPSRTDVYYRVTIEGAGRRGTSGVRSFRTLADAGAFRFVALGDSGSGSRAQHELARRMLEIDPDLVLHTGDTVYPSFSTGLVDSRMFSVYRELLMRRPWFGAFGNHDFVLGGAGFLAAFDPPTNRVTGTGHYYSFDHGDAHFAVLFQTWFIQHQIREGDDQWRWLEADLGASRKPWKFVVLHQPLISSGLHGADDYGGGESGFVYGIPDEVELRSRLLPLLVRHGVSVVFAGHDHNYERFAPIEGVVQIVSGGGGGPLYPLAVRSPLSTRFDARHHVVRVDGDADRLRIRAIAPDGSLLDDWTFRRSGVAEPSLRGAWHTVGLPGNGAPDGDGNFRGETWDLVGEEAVGVPGRFSSPGTIQVDVDRERLVVGLKDLAFPDDACVQVWIEVPGTPGVETLDGLGNRREDPLGEGVDGVDLLPGVEFVGFRPSLVALVGDEFADATDRAFMRGDPFAPIALMRPGQGVFRLAPGFPEVTNVRLSQFNRSPQEGVVYGERNADFVKVAIPWAALGLSGAPAEVKVAVTVTRWTRSEAGLRAEMDRGHHGRAMETTAAGRVRIHSVDVLLPADPDPDQDGLSTELETQLGLNPRSADSDGDGLSDGWEVAANLDPLSTGGEFGAAGDPDGDGVGNLDEWTAGTNPRDGASVFRMEVVRAAGGGWVARWAGRDGCRYELFEAMRPEGPFEVPVGSWDGAAPDGGSWERPVGGAEGARYYRLRVTRER